mmetsp:Transcript_8153/g.19700  ORF Transcript_8153/g.19700 Transcript_8153/m.19700 type:complete len:363 (-) Transcript_8153:2978-4066(-)
MVTIVCILYIAVSTARVRPRATTGSRRLRFFRRRRFAFRLFLHCWQNAHDFFPAFFLLLFPVIHSAAAFLQHQLAFWASRALLFPPLFIRVRVDVDSLSLRQASYFAERRHLVQDRRGVHELLLQLHPFVLPRLSVLLHFPHQDVVLEAEVLDAGLLLFHALADLDHLVLEGIGQRAVPVLDPLADLLRADHLLLAHLFDEFKLPFRVLAPLDLGLLGLLGALEVYCALLFRISCPFPLFLVFCDHHFDCPFSFFYRHGILFCQFCQSHLLRVYFLTVRDRSRQFEFQLISFLLHLYPLPLQLFVFFVLQEVIVLRRLLAGKDLVLVHLLLVSELLLQITDFVHEILHALLLLADPLLHQAV